MARRRRVQNADSAGSTPVLGTTRPGIPMEEEAVLETVKREFESRPGHSGA